MSTKKMNKKEFKSLIKEEVKKVMKEDDGEEEDEIDKRTQEAKEVFEKIYNTEIEEIEPVAFNGKNVKGDPKADNVPHNAYLVLFKRNQLPSVLPVDQVGQEII